MKRITDYYLQTLKNHQAAYKRGLITFDELENETEKETAAFTAAALYLAKAEAQEGKE